MGRTIIALPPAHHTGGQSSSLPSSSSVERVELRTVEQAFTQTLDLFGKPNASFFASLASFANDSDERKALELLGSSTSEGAKLVPIAQLAACALPMCCANTRPPIR